MTFKFSSRMAVIGKNLTDFHILRGFKNGDGILTYHVNPPDSPGDQPAGIWVKSQHGHEIRLQDMDGNLTGHGKYFEIKK
jgi:hypothetical protein